MIRRHQGAKMEEVHAQSKPTKIGLSDFSRLGRVRVCFKKFVCLGKIWSYRSKELRPTAYINIGHDRLLSNINKINRMFTFHTLCP
jgi:hypothetical protein